MPRNTPPISTWPLGRTLRAETINERIVIRAAHPVRDRSADEQRGGAGYGGLHLSSSGPRNEAIELLAPRPGSLILDGTCGGAAMPRRSSAGADVIALDQDPAALEFAAAGLANFGDRVILRRSNFRETAPYSTSWNCENRRRDLDLGVSSRHWKNARPRLQPDPERPARHADGSARDLTAAEVVNSYTEED